MDAAASTEVMVLGWSAVLLIVQILLQATTARDLPLSYQAGPRDEGRETRSVVSRRLDRALRNFLESYPAFVAVVVALALAGKTGGIAATGAWLYLAARIVYVPLYALGVPVIRSLAWAASMVGLVLMLIRLLF